MSSHRHKIKGKVRASLYTHFINGPDHIVAIIIYTEGTKLHTVMK